MTTITRRATLGSELSFTQGDANLDRDVITAAADPVQTDGSDNRSVYECDGTFDFTLPLATTIITPGAGQPWTDYMVTIKNVGSGVITVKTSGADTLDGVAASGDKALAAGDSITYQVNDGEDGYFAKAMSVTTPVSVTNGGTGASTHTDGGVLIGKGTGAIENTGALADGAMIVGDGTTNPTVESDATLRASIGVTIGSDVQAHDDQLDDIAALAVTNSNFIVGDGANWVAETGATARTSLGLGTGDSPQFSGVNLGHASATTLTGDAGVLSVEGDAIPTVLEGSFTGTLTGATTSPTGTIYYTKINELVMLSIPAITGTSNASSCTITGLPAALSPVTATSTNAFNAFDSFGSLAQVITITISGGATVLQLQRQGNASGFTGSSTVGPVACTVMYRLN